MFAFMRLSEGLLVAHVCLLASFLVGAAILPLRNRTSRLPASAMLRVVCTCGAGFAVCGFITFFLALAGLLSAVVLAGSFVAVIALAAALNKESLLQRSYWIVRARALTEAWDLSALLIYYVLLVIAVPAVLPNVGGDPISYHLAYPEDWARAGGLVVDPFLRSPFYASNFNLFFAAFFVFHGQVFVNFLTWSAALLTALGTLSAVRVALEDEDSIWTSLAAIALTLSTLLNPVFLRWLPTAYVDVPIGAFALLSVLCIHVSIRDHDRRWLWMAAAISGFFVGMKAPFLTLMPVLGFGIFLAARHLHVKRTGILAVLALMVLCSSPWYIRNLTLAGDPAPPVLNLAVYGRDGIMTKSEWQLIERDLNTPRTISALIFLPARAYFRAATEDFREYGTSALILLLYLPVVVWFVMFCTGRRVDSITSISVMILTFFTLYWFATATYLRYSLTFYPLLAVCVALAYASVAKLTQRRGFLVRLVPVAGVLVALGTVAATPGTKSYYRNLYLGSYKYLPSDYTGDDAYLRRFGNGYVEEEFASRIILKNRIAGRIYVMGDSVPYYFRRRGITSMGDWTGPAGFFRFAAAIDAHQALQYLRGLGVTAVMIEPDARKSGLTVPLERQLVAGGYCDLKIPLSQSRLLVWYPRGCRSLVVSGIERRRMLAKNSWRVL